MRTGCRQGDCHDRHDLFPARISSGGGRGRGADPRRGAGLGAHARACTRDRRARELLGSGQGSGPGQAAQGRQERRGLEEDARSGTVCGHAPRRHRAALHRNLCPQHGRRPVSLHLLRHGTVRQQDQVRFRHRLAELLATHLEEDRRRDPRHHLHDGPHSRVLRTLRRPSGPRLRRRPEADRAALLHELGIAEIRPPNQGLKESTMRKTFTLIAALLMNGSALADEAAKPLPAPMVDTTAPAATETAVLAGGCFWGMQGVFQHVKGVTQVVAGYSGGDKSTAIYELGGSETTGHAESVQVTFDPRVVSYGEILRVYFSVAHDPTELNRQGPDEG